MGRLGKWLAFVALAALGMCAAAAIASGLFQMRADIAAASAGAASPLSQAQRFRSARAELRAAAKAQLNDVAHDPGADPELAAMAQRQLVELCQREEQELTLEGVLAMRGWEDAVVTVHAGSVNVLLDAQVVTRQESQAILELVCRETGVPGGNVKIIPME